MYVGMCVYLEYTGFQRNLYNITMYVATHYHTTFLIFLVAIQCSISYCLSPEPFLLHDHQWSCLELEAYWESYAIPVSHPELQA